MCQAISCGQSIGQLKVTQMGDMSTVCLIGAGLKGCRGELQCKETNNTHPHTHSKVHTAVTKLHNICPLLTTLFMSSRWAIQNLHRRRAELSCLYPSSVWLAKLSAVIVPRPPRNFTCWLWIVKFTPYKKNHIDSSSGLRSTGWNGWTCLSTIYLFQLLHVLHKWL